MYVVASRVFSTSSEIGKFGAICNASLPSAVQQKTWKNMNSHHIRHGHVTGNLLADVTMHLEYTLIGDAQLDNSIVHIDAGSVALSIVDWFPSRLISRGDTFQGPSKLNMEEISV